jgi:hypothetical protein
MHKQVNYGSDGDVCEEAIMSFEVAFECPVSIKTIHNVLQQYIYVEDVFIHNPYRGHTEHVIKSDDLPAKWKTAPARIYLKEIYDKCMKDPISCIRITEDNKVDIETDAHTGTPAFLFAASLAILLHISGKDISIVVPGHQMGVPGTSLTMRRALRCLLEPSTDWSVRSVLQSMANVGSSLNP